MPFPLYAESGADSPVKLVVPGGEPFGVRLKIAGALVYDVEENSPAMRARVLPGDVIVRANRQIVKEASDLHAAVKKHKEGRIELKVQRQGKPVKLTVTREEGEEALGIFVRDSLSGIGTVSFYETGSSTFAGLGHGICARAGGQLIPMAKGTVTNVRLTSVLKGTPGRPGQLRGLFYPGQTGILTDNLPTGVYGEFESIPQKKPVAVASKDEIRPGDAEILCTVRSDGEVRSYSIRIEKILTMEDDGKNFLIRVTDRELLGETGGIVQGMSGSPILQNGRIVGAVTHVLLEDPSRGYGIYIGNMMRSGEKAAKSGA